MLDHTRNGWSHVSKKYRLRSPDHLQALLAKGFCKLKRLLFLILCQCLAVTGTALAAPPEYWASTSYETIFKDTIRPTTFSKKIEMLAVRNEYESAQINLRHPTSFSVIGIHPSSMTSGTNLLAGSNVSGRAIEYKRYEANSPTLTDKVRDAPADYPDAISNVEKVTVSPKTTQGLWVTVHVPKKDAAGALLRLASD